MRNKKMKNYCIAEWVVIIILVILLGTILLDFKIIHPLPNYTSGAKPKLFIAVCGNETIGIVYDGHIYKIICNLSIGTGIVNTTYIINSTRGDIP